MIITQSVVCVVTKETDMASDSSVSAASLTLTNTQQWYDATQDNGRHCFIITSKLSYYNIVVIDITLTPGTLKPK